MVPSVAVRRAALGLALALLGCGPGDDPPLPLRGDVVLLTVDTLRADHLGIYGYSRDTSPELARWFGDGAVFERAYSSSASTPPGAVTVLTGMSPDEHGVRHFYQLVPEATPILSDRLRHSHRTAGFVSNAALADEALGIADRFDHFDDFVSDVVPVPGTAPIVERDARATTDAVLAWLDAEPADERPIFLWVHYMDPHAPYEPPEGWRGRYHHEGRIEADAERIKPYMRDDSVDDALDYVDRYDEEIAFTDSEIGRLLDALHARRGLDAALLVLTADHGEIMTERKSWFRHGYHVFEEIVRVPLLLRGPGVRAGRFALPVSTADVASTVMRFVGDPGAGGLDGLDLRDPPAATERPVFAEATIHTGQWSTALVGDEKWIAWTEAGAREPSKRGRFDLARDPGEKRPMNWQPGSAGAQALLARIAEDPDPGGQPTSAERFRRGVRLDAPKLPPGLPPDAHERLRALGYVE